MVDMGQYDARRPVLTSPAEQEVVFARHRERVRLISAEMSVEETGCADQSPPHVPC